MVLANWLVGVKSFAVVLNADGETAVFLLNVYIYLAGLGMAADVCQGFADNVQQLGLGYCW